MLLEGSLTWYIISSTIDARFSVNSETQYEEHAFGRKPVLIVLNYLLWTMSTWLPCGLLRWGNTGAMQSLSLKFCSKLCWTALIMSDAVMEYILTYRLAFW